MSSKKKNIITVFEHQCLYINRGEVNKRLTLGQFKTLEQFYGDGKIPYYSLLNNGVRFCEYVGVLQLGNLTIEILPKADNQDADKWRSKLVDMLQAVGVFNVHAPSNSGLNLKSNSILDLYFELFIQETEALLHKGLIKKYRKQDGNQTALKGSLQFAQQIQKNLTHQELFYTRHTVYDKQHPLNQVLLKTIKLLVKINTNMSLQSKVGSLLLNFPELPDIKVTDAFFNKLQYNRKTEPYQKAIQIARLLLLNYHPDLKQANNDVLALMFDMNVLWEEFVAVSLRKYLDKKYSVSLQSSKSFWRPENGHSRKIRPDIVIKQMAKELFVVDTKWKNIWNSYVSDDDLKQMYVYSKYHSDAATLLVYPGNGEGPLKGQFHHEVTTEEFNGNCGILKIETALVTKQWQQNIADRIFDCFKVFQQIEAVQSTPVNQINEPF